MFLICHIKANEAFLLSKTTSDPKCNQFRLQLYFIYFIQTWIQSENIFIRCKWVGFMNIKYPDPYYMQSPIVISSLTMPAYVRIILISLITRTERIPGADSCTHHSRHHYMDIVTMVFSSSENFTKKHRNMSYGNIPQSHIIYLLTNLWLKIMAYNNTIEFYLS